MIGYARQPLQGDRRGFTLVEVCLTLCLMVIIAALVWPVMHKPIANQRLKESADRVRVAWCEARVDAMDDGAIYVFHYAIEGNRYRIQRRDDLLATADAEVEQGTSLPSVSGTPSVVERLLPRGIVFETGQIEPDNRAALLGIGGNAAGSSAADVNWSAPIVFYPDGTTSTAQLVMRNEHDRRVRLSLRGLTGVVHIGGLSAEGGAAP